MKGLCLHKVLPEFNPLNAGDGHLITSRGFLIQWNIYSMNHKNTCGPIFQHLWVVLRCTCLSRTSDIVNYLFVFVSLVLLCLGFLVSRLLSSNLSFVFLMVALVWWLIENRLFKVPEYPLTFNCALLMSAQIWPRHWKNDISQFMRATPDNTQTKNTHTPNVCCCESLITLDGCWTAVIRFSLSICGFAATTKAMSHKGLYLYVSQCLSNNQIDGLKISLFTFVLGVTPQGLSWIELLLTAQTILVYIWPYVVQWLYYWYMLAFFCMLCTWNCLTYLFVTTCGCQPKSSCGHDHNWKDITNSSVPLCQSCAKGFRNPCLKSERVVKACLALWNIHSNMCSKHGEGIVSLWPCSETSRQLSLRNVFL